MKSVQVPMSGSLTNSKRATHCLVCKCASTGTILYVCDSRHVVCNNCQNNGAGAKPNPTTDGQEQRRHSVRHSKKELKRSARVRNLASGDHEEPTKEQAEDFITSKTDSDLKATIEYANVNYCESNSSSDTNVKMTPKAKKNRSKLTSQRREIISRPIYCPHCKKMITTTTLHQHFQFDHSKLPIVSLPFKLSQEILIKTSNITAESHCVALFQPKRLCNSTYAGDNFPLLLMTAKIDIFANIAIQTDLAHGNSEQIFGKNNFVTVQNDKETLSAYPTNEVLVIWIVNIADDDNNIYNISISDENSTYCYSYTGKAVNIKDEQVALKIYHTAKCLVIYGQAISRVVCDLYLHVSVTMISKNKVI